MTFGIYIVLVIGLLLGVLNFLPTAAALDPQVLTAILTFSAKLKSMQFIGLPVDHTLLAVKYTIYYELIIWTWIGVVKLVKFFRGNHSGE